MHARHVRKTGHESHHVDAIRRRAMKSDHFLFGGPRERRDIGEIRSEFSSVAHVHVDQGAFLGRAIGKRHRGLPKVRFERGRVDLKGIEIDGDRAVTHHDVAHGRGAAALAAARASATARPLTAGSIRAGSSTSSAASPAGTIRKSLIGQCARASSAESSFWWMLSNPPFDMTITRSPDRASSATVRTMSAVSGMYRASTPAVLRSAISPSVESRSFSGNVERNTAGSTT